MDYTTVPEDDLVALLDVETARADAGDKKASARMIAIENELDRRWREEDPTASNSFQDMVTRLEAAETPAKKKAVELELFGDPDDIPESAVTQTIAPMVITASPPKKSKAWMFALGAVALGALSMRKS